MVKYYCKFESIISRWCRLLHFLKWICEQTYVYDTCDEEEDKRCHDYFRYKAVIDQDLLAIESERINNASDLSQFLLSLSIQLPFRSHAFKICYFLQFSHLFVSLVFCHHKLLLHINYFCNFFICHTTSFHLCNRGSTTTLLSSILIALHSLFLIFYYKL